MLFHLRANKQKLMQAYLLNKTKSKRMSYQDKFVVQILVFSFVIIDALAFNLHYSILGYGAAIISIGALCFLLLGKQVLGLCILLALSVLYLGELAYLNSIEYGAYSQRYFGMSIFTILWVLTVLALLLLNNALRNRFFLLTLGYVACLSVLGWFHSGAESLYGPALFSDLSACATIIFAILAWQALPPATSGFLLTLLLRASVAQVLLMIILKGYTLYDIHTQYLALGAWASILPVVLLLHILCRPSTEVYIYAFLIGFVMLSGQYPLLGKNIVLFSIIFLWYCVAALSRLKMIHLIQLSIVLLAVGYLFFFANSEFSSNQSPTTHARVDQLRSVLESDMTDFVSAKTSGSNAIAELVTIYSNHRSHFLPLLLGSGLGSGISDAQGWLSVYAGAGGYPAISASYDFFYKMHTGLADVFLKSGVLGVFLLILLCLRHHLIVGAAILLYAFLFLNAFKETFLVVFLLLRFRDLMTSKRFKQRLPSGLIQPA